MKKALISIIVVVFIIAGIAFIHYANKPPQAPDVLEELADTGEPSPAGGATGETVSFELTYRGLSGKKGELQVSNRYGFGTRDEPDSAFIQAVKEKTDNHIYAARNPYLTERPYTAIEYQGHEILAVYFDLDADGKPADNERLRPTEVSENNRMGNDGTVFLTPDFTVTPDNGRKAPFRIILWVDLYQDVPIVRWSTMGLYEGTAKINGEKMRFYLFPDFFNKSYDKYGSSDYALVPADNEDNYVPRHNLSSLIVHDKTFYRLAVTAHDDDARTLTVRLTEDKSPRGKVALKVHGSENFKHDVTSATLQGTDDKSIYFSVGPGMDELPIGDYVISSGDLNYGQKNTNDFSTSFGSLPAFAIKTDQTTTVELGKPEAKLAVVELNKRYQTDRQAKTEFTEGTPLYVDVSFAGMNGESYRGFRQRVQKENYTTSEYIKANLAIVDGSNNTIVSEDMEPG